MPRISLTEEQEYRLTETIDNAINEAISVDSEHPKILFTSALRKTIAQKCISIIDAAIKARIPEIKLALELGISGELETWYPASLRLEIQNRIIEAISQMEDIMQNENGKPR